jgi:hypothetical protein
MKESQLARLSMHTWVTAKCARKGQVDMCSEVGKSDVKVVLACGVVVSQGVYIKERNNVHAMRKRQKVS